MTNFIILYKKYKIENNTDELYIQMTILTFVKINFKKS